MAARSETLGWLIFFRFALAIRIWVDLSRWENLPSNQQPGSARNRAFFSLRWDYGSGKQIFALLFI